MTNDLKECIKAIEHCFQNSTVFSTVLDAAKKQIAVAPIVYTDTRQQVYTDVQVDTYECPMCGSYLCDCDDADEYGPLYCPDCGQKLDWSVLDE